MKTELKNFLKLNMKTNNKLTRKLEEEKKINKRNADLGWPTKEEIPLARKKAIKDGGYRIPRRSDKKRFTGCFYGQRSGYSNTHLTKKDLIERAQFRDELL